MENRNKKKVVIYEPRPELARMEAQFLVEEGYEVSVCGEGCDLVAEVHGFKPDALVVELDRLASLEVLDWLRTDHETARVPILAVARSKDLRDRALASYNVKKALTKPFDPEDLLTKLRQVLRQPPLHAGIPEESTHDGIVGMAEYLLARHSRATLVRWVQELQEEPPWSEREDLSFENLVDVTPLVVEALVAAFHYRDPLRYFAEHPEAAGRISAHGKIRRSQDLPMSSLMREYSLLRDEVWVALWSRLPRTISTADVINLQRIVNGTMDYLSEIVVSAYVDAPVTLPPEERETALDEMATAGQGGPATRQKAEEGLREAS